MVWVNADQAVLSCHSWKLQLARVQNHRNLSMSTKMKMNKMKESPRDIEEQWKRKRKIKKKSACLIIHVLVSLAAFSTIRICVEKKLNI